MGYLSRTFFILSFCKLAMPSYAYDILHDGKQPLGTTSSEAQGAGGIPCGKIAEVLGRLAAGENLSREQIADILGVPLKSAEGFRTVTPPANVGPIGQLGRMQSKTAPELIGELRKFGGDLGPAGEPLRAAIKKRLNLSDVAGKIQPVSSLSDTDIQHLADYLNAANLVNNGHLSPPVIQQLSQMVTQKAPAELGGMGQVLYEMDIRLNTMIQNGQANATREQAFTEVIKDHPEVMRSFQISACQAMGKQACAQLGGAEKIPFTDSRIQAYLKQMYSCLSSAWH